MLRSPQPENRSSAPSEPCRCPDAWAADAWAIDLREQLVEDGYEGERVDALMRDAVARYRSARIAEFVPLFVERSVQRALRNEQQKAVEAETDRRSDRGSIEAVRGS